MNDYTKGILTGVSLIMRNVIFLLLAVQFILAQDLLTQKNGKTIQGEFDINTSQNESLRFKPAGTDNWQWYHRDLVNSVKSFNGELIFPYGIMVNQTSKVYHLPTVKHIPDESNRQFFENRKDAETAGYSPCLACFDDSPMISDYQLERNLVRSTVIAFQNTREILYEHPELPDLQIMVDKILSQWPESLKGYDFRIQVYRDEDPNAMAIGGGNLYVSSGLLDIVENDSELEAIIAHEIAHVERRHTLRQFYEYQKKKSAAALATLLVGVTVLAAGGEAEDLGLAVQVTALVADFAAEMALKGYTREMEQEADIMAQLYFFQNEKSSTSMIAVFDKFATNIITRAGYLRGVSAFSSHPGLLQRINQIENSSVFRYDNPLTLSVYPTPKAEQAMQKIGINDIEGGFVKLDINYIYKAPSSNKEDEDIFYLVGSIVNEHQTHSFRIEEITLNILGSIGKVGLQGVEGKTVSLKGFTDFTGFIRVPTKLSQDVHQALENKKILPYSIGLSAVVLQKGKNAKAFGSYQTLQCMLVIE